LRILRQPPPAQTETSTQKTVMPSRRSTPQPVSLPPSSCAAMAKSHGAWPCYLSLRMDRVRWQTRGGEPHVGSAPTRRHLRVRAFWNTPVVWRVWLGRGEKRTPGCTGSNAVGAPRWRLGGEVALREALAHPRRDADCEQHPRFSPQSMLSSTPRECPNWRWPAVRNSSPGPTFQDYPVHARSLRQMAWMPCSPSRAHRRLPGCRKTQDARSSLIVTQFALGDAKTIVLRTGELSSAKSGPCKKMPDAGPYSAVRAGDS